MQGTGTMKKNPKGLRETEDANVRHPVSVLGVVDDERQDRPGNDINCVGERSAPQTTQ